MTDLAGQVAWPSGESEMARRIRAHDWAATAIGRSADWPSSLRTIVELVLGNAFPMAVLWGPELVQIYNDACIAVLGERHPNGLGQANHACYAEFRGVKEPIHNRVFDGETVRVEDGKFRLARHGTVEDAWFTVSYSPLRDDTGKVTGILATALETTSRVRAEHLLREGRAKQVFLLALEDALRPLTSAAAIQRTASQLLSEHLGASRALYVDIDGEPGEETGEMRGQYVAHGTPAPQRVRCADWGESEIVAASRRGESIVVSDCSSDPRLSEADRGMYLGSGAYAFVSSSLVKAGRWVASFCVVSDAPRSWTATEVALVRETAERTWAAAERARAELARSEAEAALRRALSDATAAREEAERANAAKDDFLTILGHELRTPLAAITLWIGVIRSANLPPDQLTRAIQAIADSADSQSRLVDDLMDLSRLALGRLELRREPVDIQRLIESLVEVARPAAEARTLALVVEVSPGLGSTLADSERLKQIVWNLLNNAMKFTPTEGRIGVVARRQHDTLLIEVRDTGVGISAEFLPHVFERFSQAERGTTRRYEGLGIGLALSKELAELHAGDIQVESAGLGQGTLFRVRLPWVDPRTTSQPNASPQRSTVTAGRASATPRTYVHSRD